MLVIWACQRRKEKSKPLERNNTIIKGKKRKKDWHRILYETAAIKFAVLSWKGNVLMCYFKKNVLRCSFYIALVYTSKCPSKNPFSKLFCLSSSKKLMIIVLPCPPVWTLVPDILFNSECNDFKYSHKECWSWNVVPNLFFLTNGHKDMPKEAEMPS